MLPYLLTVTNTLTTTNILTNLLLTTDCSLTVKLFIVLLNLRSKFLYTLQSYAFSRFYIIMHLRVISTYTIPYHPSNHIFCYSITFNGTTVYISL